MEWSIMDFLGWRMRSTSAAMRCWWKAAGAVKRRDQAAQCILIGTCTCADTDTQQYQRKTSISC